MIRNTTSAKSGSNNVKSLFWSVLPKFNRLHQKTAFSRLLCYLHTLVLRALCTVVAPNSESLAHIPSAMIPGFIGCGHIQLNAHRPPQSMPSSPMCICQNMAATGFLIYTDNAGNNFAGHRGHPLCADRVPQADMAGCKDCFRFVEKRCDG
jgi:hypothetical protein